MGPVCLFMGHPAPPPPPRPNCQKVHIVSHCGPYIKKLVPIFTLPPGCEVLFWLCLCLSVCPVNILVFYFLAIDGTLLFEGKSYYKNWAIENVQYFCVDTSLYALSNETITTWANREMTSQKYVPSKHMLNRRFWNRVIVWHNRDCFLTEPSLYINWHVVS